MASLDSSSLFPKQLGVFGLFQILNSFEQREFGRNLTYPIFWPLDEEWESFNAKICAAAVHSPDCPETQRGYAAFINENHRQLEAVFQADFHIELFEGKGEPYASSILMMRDVQHNKHLFVLKTASMPAGHPLGVQSPIHGFTENCLFRALHDVIHAAFAFPFSARGEESACRAHAALYSATAVPALLAETGLPSAWVYFGDHLRDMNGHIAKEGEPGFIPYRDRQFSPQKAFLAPPECLDYVLWRRINPPRLEVAA